MSFFRAMLQWWSRRPAALRWVAVIAWAGLIWFLSSRPGRGPGSSSLRTMAYNSAHLVVFAALATLVLTALSQKPRSGQAWWAVLVSTAYGVVDELHQGSVPGRVSSVGDAVTDLCGSVIGVCLVMWWLQRWQRGPGWGVTMALIVGVLSVTEVIG